MEMVTMSVMISLKDNEWEYLSKVRAEATHTFTLPRSTITKDNMQPLIMAVFDYVNGDYHKAMDELSREEREAQGGE